MEQQQLGLQPNLNKDLKKAISTIQEAQDSEGPQQGFEIKEIEPFNKRGDERGMNPIGEAYLLYLVSKIKPLYDEQTGIISFLTFAASPHNRAKFKEKNINFNAHMVGWAIQTSNPEEAKKILNAMSGNDIKSVKDIALTNIKITEDTDTDKINTLYAHLLELNKQAKDFFIKKFALEINDHQHLRTYFHNGHTPQELKSKGFKPSNQSNPFFHWHIVLFDKSEKQVQRVWPVSTNSTKNPEANTNIEISEEVLYLANKLIDPMGRLMSHVLHKRILSIISQLGLTAISKENFQIRPGTNADLITSTTFSIDIDKNNPNPIEIAETLKKELTIIRSSAMKLYEIIQLAKYLFYKENSKRGGYQSISSKVEISAQKLGYNLTEIQNNLRDIRLFSHKSASDFDIIKRVLFHTPLPSKYLDHLSDKFANLLSDSSQSDISKIRNNIIDFMDLQIIDDSFAKKEEWIKAKQHDEQEKLDANPEHSIDQAKIMYQFFSRFFIFSGVPSIIFTIKDNKLVFSISESAKGGAEALGQLVKRINTNEEKNVQDIINAILSNSH